MLVELKVSNFAIIDQIQLEFGPDLNIISGETGAGKSVIVRALGLLMGAKSQTDDVREGLDQSIVEGHFDLSSRKDILSALKEFGITSTEQELLVRRIISRDGKNRVYINGHLSTLTDLKNIVAPLVEVTGRNTPLIEVTGQNDNKNLLSPQYHLDMLDQFCQTWDLRKKVFSLFSRTQEIERQIEELQGSSRDRSQRVDFIKFQIDEISQLDLDADKDAQLEEQIKILKNQNSISQFYQNSIDALEGDGASALGLLDKILKNALSLKHRPESVESIIETLQSAKQQISESAFELNQLVGQSLDESELEKLESRLSDLRRLQKKFGPSVADILSAYEEMKKELDTLENSEQKIAQLEIEKKALLNELSPLLTQLTQQRKKGSLKLAEKVNNELIELNMKGVLFSVQIETAPVNGSGQDSVVFAIQNGAKGESRPLQKSASGGELSRILLSLKIAVGEIDSPRTYLFDEVDTGVSGPTAQKVGKKLKEIANGQQVICITHLPQVASFADQHYFISKKSVKGHMNMTAVCLQGKDKVEEIARLISGEKVTSTSLAHAKQLLEDAH
ncbi:DNA repair protein RecN [bacterium]|nr:DNA repair protein RecN [bacterium]